MIADAVTWALLILVLVLVLRITMDEGETTSNVNAIEWRQHHIQSDMQKLQNDMQKLATNFEPLEALPNSISRIANSKYGGQSIEEWRLPNRVERASVQQVRAALRDAVNVLDCLILMSDDVSKSRRSDGDGR